MDNSTERPVNLWYAAEFVTHGDVRPEFGAKGNRACVRLYLDGEGIYHDETERVEIHPGTLCLFPPGRVGRLEAKHSSCRYHYLYCKFDGAFAIEWANRIVCQRGSVKVVEGDGISELIVVMRSVISHWQKGSPARFGLNLGELGVLDLLARLDKGGREFKRKKQFTIDETFLKEFLEEHLSEPTDLPAFAEELGIAVSTLSSKARRLLGTSLQQYHERMKICEACKMLRETDLPIRTIANVTGYRDPLYFSRVFRKHKRMSPRQWRQSRRL
ncbi:MAG: AraC family transcriptional regulator [Lentisphaerae bacterium]|nr:MAG: AraC family transcriptional regulator [Lentisphaerota bacterium]